MKTSLIGGLRDEIDTTNKNMQSQFAQVRKEFKAHRDDVIRELKKHGDKVKNLDSKMDKVLVAVKDRAQKGRK